MPDVKQLPEVWIYGVGLVYMSICCPANMTDDGLVEVCESQHPCGTTHGWMAATDETFSDGVTPHPAPCPDREGYVHRLVTC